MRLVFSPCFPPCMQGVEVLRGSAFSTTETFTTTHGFVISTPPASCVPPAAAGRSRSSSNCSNSSNNSAVVVNNRQPSEQPSTPVGWSGLLEISRFVHGLPMKQQ